MWKILFQSDVYSVGIRSFSWCREIDFSKWRMKAIDAVQASVKDASVMLSK